MSLNCPFCRCVQHPFTELTSLSLTVQSFMSLNCPFCRCVQHPFTELSSLSSGNRDSHDKRVLMWYFESQLKKKFAELVAALEVTKSSLLLIHCLINNIVLILTLSVFFSGLILLYEWHIKVKGPDIYILPKPEQQQFTIWSGILASISSRQHSPLSMKGIWSTAVVKVLSWQSDLTWGNVRKVGQLEPKVVKSDVNSVIVWKVN